MAIQPDTPVERVSRHRHEAVLLLQVDEAVVPTVTGIDIQDDDAAGRTGSDTDIGIRPSPPPPDDDGRVRGSVVHAVRGARVLAGAPAVLPTAGAVSVGDGVKR